jgi:proline iminopeptidase/L-proline amide hydrolase
MLAPEPAGEGEAMAAKLSRRDVLLGLGAAAVAAPVAPAALARLPAIPPPDRELMVPVQGGRVYVRVNGPLAGPRLPLVMIHGGPGSTHSFALEALALADERAIILYDQLDSGRSDRPEDPRNWTVDRFASELEPIRAALGVPRWHVLGASWGGTIALEYGARRPAALDALILQSPLVSTRSWLADAALLRRGLSAEVQAELVRCEARRPPPRARCDAATDAFYAQYLAREPRSAARTAYAPPGDRGRNQHLYEAMWGPSEFRSSGSLRAYDGEPLLARLDGHRTLFVVGQYDEARPQTALGFVRRVPGAELAVVPGGGHAILNDRPDEMNAIVRAFLARMEARG